MPYFYKGVYLRKADVYLFGGCTWYVAPGSARILRLGIKELLSVCVNEVLIKSLPPPQFHTQ